jgi:dipeptidyl aminopeptidase/acylaminoacyl peptidase
MGGSYGGYATLVGLTFTPEVFACGVDIVGPSNLITLLETIPPYWAPMIELFSKRAGDHRTTEGRKLLAERSPLTYADRIRKPLLIGQGANDPRVKQSESDQIVTAMKEKGIPLIPREGPSPARRAANAPRVGSIFLDSGGGDDSKFFAGRTRSEAIRRGHSAKAAKYLLGAATDGAKDVITKPFTG